MRAGLLVVSITLVLLLAHAAAPAGAACPGECSTPGGGSKRTDCMVEFDGLVPSGGSRAGKMRCEDGEAGCDADGVANGSCLFVISACLNNADPRLPACAASDVAQFEVKNPAPGKRRHEPDRERLADAVLGLGLPSADSECSAGEPIAVPLKLSRKGRYRTGRLKVRSTAEDSGGRRDRDRLSLTCKPSDALPAPGVASARVIASDQDRIEGPLSRGGIGDFLLANDRIQVVILRPGRNAYNAVGLYGGNLADADRVRDGEPERDHFEALAFGLNFENTAHYTDVTILNDGSDGGAAVIRATGPDDLLDAINPSSVVEELGFVFPESADDTDLPVAIQTDYLLEPGADAVRIDTTVTNQGAEPVEFFASEYINGSGQLEAFHPAYGLGLPELTTACGSALDAPCPGGTCNLCDFVAFTGEDGASGVSYGLLDPAAGSTTFATSGVIGRQYGVETGLALLGIDGPNFRLEAAGTPGDTLSLTRHFVVGEGSVGSVLDVRNAIRGVARGRLRGVVSSSAGPVADADVAVTGPFAPGFLGGPDVNVVAHYRTDVQGAYGGSLPPGDYTVQVSKGGNGLSSPETADIAVSSGQEVVQDFSLLLPGRFRVTVTDDAGAPVPAKVQLVGFDPFLTPITTQDILGQITAHGGVFGDPGRDTPTYGIARVAFADRTGDTGWHEAPAGDYQVVVSRGPRYSAFSAPLTLAAGSDSAVAAQIALVVPTPGFVAGDWHVHSIDSADSEVTRHERVATMLAEGMDLFTPSDHEIRVDFAPTLAAMGVSDLISVAPSSEMTTFDYGHFNSWPVSVDPDRLNGGSVDHGGAAPPGEDFPSYGNFNLTPGEIVAAAHADPKGNLVQINHMASHFSRDGLAIDTALVPPQSSTDGVTRRLDPGVANYFDSGFDALEVWIGTDGTRGAEGEFLGQNAGDWFNLINQGIVRAGVTSSDTHSRVETNINARSYVASASDDPGALAALAESLADNASAGRLTGTNGPYLTVTVEGSTGQVAGHALGMPTQIETQDGSVEVTVAVKSPAWAEFDRFELYVNNAPEPVDDDADAATPDRYRVCPDFTQAVAPALVVDFPGIAAGHLEASHTFSLGGLSEDTWIVAMVKGTDGLSRPLFPVYADDIDQVGNETLPDLLDGNLGEGGMLALAYANPLFVDVDGGAWSAPGVALGTCP